MPRWVVLKSLVASLVQLAAPCTLTSITFNFCLANFWFQHGSLNVQQELFLLLIRPGLALGMITQSFLKNNTFWLMQRLCSNPLMLLRLPMPRAAGMKLFDTVYSVIHAQTPVVAFLEIFCPKKCHSKSKEKRFPL